MTTANKFKFQQHAITHYAVNTNTRFVQVPRLNQIFFKYCRFENLFCFLQYQNCQVQYHKYLRTVCRRVSSGITSIDLKLFENAYSQVKTQTLFIHFNVYTTNKPIDRINKKTTNYTIKIYCLAIVIEKLRWGLRKCHKSSTDHATNITLFIYTYVANCIYIDS